MTKTQQTFKPGDEVIIIVPEGTLADEFEPGDEVIIIVPEGTLADEFEPGGEYIEEDMLNWTEGYIDRDDAYVSKANSIRVYKPDGSDYWRFPVSWLKLKNPTEDVQETKEKKLPDSFRFKTGCRSDYKATWNESRGRFFISWNDGVNSTIYNKDYVEECVEDGYWTIIEEVEVQPVQQCTEATEEVEEQEITLESLDKQILEAALNVEHLESLREVFLNARALGYKLTKA